MQTNDALILSTLHDGVLTLTLNRPQALNALNGALSAELTRALHEAADTTGVRAILLTGAGRAFSAGGDLQAILKTDRATFADQLRADVTPLILAMRRSPKPIVSAVNGIAYGGGMGVALAGDVVVAARSAKFAQSFAGVGLVPDSGCTWILPRLIGESRARAMMLTTESIDAEEAHRIGLVWEVFNDDDLMPKALALSQKLASMATRSFSLIKEALDVSATNTLEQQLEHEAIAQQNAAATQDFQEGIAAIVGKRKPVFSGR